MHTDGETSSSKIKNPATERYSNGDYNAIMRKCIREGIIRTSKQLKDYCTEMETILQKDYFAEMETKLQKLGTTSEKTDFAERIHSERSNQEAVTTSEKTELAYQSSSEKLKQRYLATLTKRLLN